MSKYTLTCLFAQRVCSYEGEFAPELITAVDEYTMDANPEYVLDEVRKAEANTTEFSAVAVVNVEVDFEAIERALHPTTKLQGKVVPVELE